MRLAILGFGLIGGSVARALAARAPSDWTVTALSRTPAGPRRARADGVIASAAENLDGALEGADLVLLGAPPLACLELLDDLAGLGGGSLAPGAVITDVASTKRAIVARATELSLPFVGGHPMAGVETTGYDSADPDLFVGRPWVVCAAPGAAGVPRVEGLARAVGAVPIRLDPAEHDDLVAAISHLPLVVSAALSEAVLGAPGDTRGVRRLAAGGWASMTRLARGDVEMATGITATNAGAIARQLRGLRTVLDAWLAELETAEPDSAVLRRRFAAARDRLEAAE
jgi:prephenate dehydrogenase